MNINFDSLLISDFRREILLIILELSTISSAEKVVIQTYYRDPPLGVGHQEQSLQILHTVSRK